MKKFKYIKHKGFTLVEVMLLLVVLSLIFASSTAVITRKHKLKPRKAVHGKYICYLDKNDNLHEIMWAGKNKIKDETYTPEQQAAGSECTFTGPRNTSYLYVQILGGGGAGGNADFYEDKKTSTEGKFISLFGNDALNCKSATYPGDCENSYTTFSNTNGITKDFIDGLFKDSENNSLFSGNIYRKLLNDYGVQLFSFDRAGGGSSGMGYKFLKADSSTDEPSFGCSCDYSNYLGNYRTFTTAAACAKNCNSNKKNTSLDPHTDPGFWNDTATCMMNSGNSDETNSNNCPEGYLKRVLKKTEQTCEGGSGGSGSVFTSELIPFDFGVSAVILGRNYNGGRGTIDWDTSETATSVWDALKNKGGKHYITDRAGTSFTIDKSKDGSTLDLVIDPAALVSGTLTTCKEGDPDCVKYPDGIFYKIVNEPEFSYYYYKDEYFRTDSYSWNRPYSGYYTRIFATKPSYDFSKDKYVTPDFSEYTQAKIDSEYSYLQDNGLYPYQVLSSCNTHTLANCSYEDAVSAGNPVGVGLTTAHGTNYYTFRSNEILQGSSPFGKHGDSILGSEIKFNDKAIFSGCPYASSGASGNTSFKSSLQPMALGCSGNMGVYLSNASYRERFHNYYTKGSYEKYHACNDSGEPTSKADGRENLGLLIRFVQASISLSHGEHGRAGEVKSLFARSFGSDTIKLYPGKGGLHVDIDTDKTEGHRVARGKDGTPSSLKYNCNPDGTNCDEIEALGGIGGKSRIWEDSKFTRINSQDIYNLINNTPGSIDKFLNKTSAYYTAAAPNNYRGETSSFTETSKLLDLPVLDGIDLSDLGKGGDGGYVTYQCLILPQYFQVVWGTKSETIDNFPKASLPGAESEWEGYTKFTEAEAKEACQGHLSADAEGKTYQETGGTDGLPGAIVIMW